MQDAVAELRARRTKAEGMGGEAEIAKQHALGKLTARERLDLLFDPGTFIETGRLADHAGVSSELKGKYMAADGVITGTGRIHGRLVCAAAYDFTIMAGSIGIVGETKVTRLRQWALQERLPIVWLLDSAGARIQEMAGAMFAGTGDLFYEQAIMSGVIPQVAAVMGHCAAGTAYIPALADVTFMVSGTSSMALAGPPLVKAVIGEDVTVEDLGGAKVHCQISGVGDVAFPDDASCIAAIRRYLSYFPSRAGEKPPMVPAIDPKESAESLLTVLPENPKHPYDMKTLIRLLVDGGDLFELKPQYAQNIVTALARIGGRSVGIIASQPKVMAGVLTTDAADKAARFVMLCDAFEIPLLFVQDVPGFMVGSKVEKEGIIRHGAKLLHVVANATVPKVTVVVRKGYGAGYYVMCGRGFQPDGLFAWPTAEISLMGPEGAVNIIYRKRIAEAADPEAERAALVEQYRGYIGPYLSAEKGLVDDVIDPRETRVTILRTLELSDQRTAVRPLRKHGVMPV
ncbi:MAG: acyl-CoA carboxylase subunit beta [Candidatus Sericytochromatia bacterium]|nr:acyl-CoA carboxylase subunit beta [Candidatus Sericytochromatia bacterium]